MASLPPWVLLALGMLLTLSFFVIGMKIGEKKGWKAAKKAEKKAKTRQRRQADRADARMENMARRLGDSAEIVEEDFDDDLPPPLTISDVMPVVRANLDEILDELAEEGVYSEPDIRKEMTWVKSVLDCYVGAPVLTRLDRARGGRAVLAGHIDLSDSVHCTILFLDLRGFTRATEDMANEYIMRLLNAYLRVLAEVVISHGGTVDKFIGDNIMATFGAPKPVENSADAAMSCALVMIEQMKKVNEQLVESGASTLEPSIGIGTGPIIGGTLGGFKRRAYTVIGPAVNRAARLESATRSVECDVLIDDASYKMLTWPPSEMKAHYGLGMKGIPHKVPAWSWSRPTVGSKHDPDAPMSVDPL